MSKYKVLSQNEFSHGDYSIVPIRMEDRHAIRKWRNEQIYHLRQSKPLSEADQDRYFENVVAKLFDQEKPSQLLFSYLKGDTCIGYGGLVHINWQDKHAEISFIMDTSLQENTFELHWVQFSGLIESVAFNDLGFQKIFTYAFDIRPRLYRALEKAEFVEDARLINHCQVDGELRDVLIHARFADAPIQLRSVTLKDAQVAFRWTNDARIRQFSFQQELTSWQEHKNWFHEKVRSETCHYYFLTRTDAVLGSIRFDINDVNEALVSFHIDPEFHKQGLGKLILQEGVKRLVAENKVIKSVTGFVMNENVASKRIFEKMGFTIVESESDKVKCKYKKPV